jgi:broad specificity phosphatase PhoE
MKLYVVRHAQSKRNVGHHSDNDAELTVDGEEQARRLGKFFHKVKLNKVYCSPMKRARATLEAIKPYIKNVKISIIDNSVDCIILEQNCLDREF